jgi:hypothetical protein
MRTVQGNVLQSLLNVEAFLDEHAERLPDVVKSGAKQRLVDAIALLEGHANQQVGSMLASQGATKRQEVLRTALLRDHMAKIASIAHAEFPKTPEFEPLRMPRLRMSPQKLRAAASGMAQTAAPQAAVFVAAGLPADFIDQLNAAADAMIASLGERSQSRGKRTGATSGLKEKLSAGRKIVRVLDTFVKSALKDDPSLLANWKVVKRVQRVTGRVAGTIAPAPVPTPSTHAGT